MRTTAVAEISERTPGEYRAEGLPELARLVAAKKLPELVPTHQERSLRTALGLINAGRALLHERSLEDLSIELVCQHAGATVGAFYRRFESKHAFFVTLQRIVAYESAELNAQFWSRHQGENSTLESLCSEIVALSVNNFRANLGVLRASLQHTHEGMWNLFRDLGFRNRAAHALHLEPYLSSLPATQRLLRVQFAHQAMVGTLVHVVLNDPGPLSLEDERLTTELARMFKALLLAP